LTRRASASAWKFSISGGFRHFGKEFQLCPRQEIILSGPFGAKAPVFVIFLKQTAAPEGIELRPMNMIAMQSRNQSNGTATIALRAPAQWLPAPAEIWMSDRTSRPTTKAAVRRIDSVVQPGTYSGLEQVMFVLLAFVAVVGIGYGFSCILDLVQHWAAFNTGIAQILQ
jgi:hypothetical protein